MATYATNLTTFWLTGATTVTALGGGAAALGNPETDFFIQGTDSLSKAAWTNAIKGFIVDALGGNFTVPTNGAIILFAKYDAAGSLDTKANGGLRIVVGSGSGDYYHYYVGGKTTLAFDSWIPYVVDPNTATADNTTGTPSGSERWVGILANLPTTSGPTKGNPIAVDAIRYGRCDLEYTDTAATFSGAEAWANDVTRRWGLLELIKGAYQMQGFHSFGTGAASVTFSDSNKVLFFRPSGANNLTNDAVSTGFNRIEILNAGSSVTWDNISISALGTRARGVFVHTAGTVNFTNCQFTDMDTFSFLASATCTGTTFRRCNAVTAPGSTLNNSSILASTVAADTGALIYNSATDTDGKLDNMTFSKGAAAHHAIDFGTSVTGDITLRGCEFTGFDSTPDSNGAAFRFLASSGALTLSLIGCTVNGAAATESNIAVDDAAGINVSLSISPVTTSIHINDEDGNDYTAQDVRVYVIAKDGTGPMPYQDSVTLTHTTTTAHVAHTAHGLKDGQKVLIEGADQQDYNGVSTITNVTTNAYDYTMPGDPGTDASGTTIATAVIIDSLTNASGDVSDQRVLSSNQPIIGWARKGSASPYYEEAGIDDEINSSTGFSLTIKLVLDE